MAEVTHEQVPTNGIELHVAVAGPPDGPPVVLCHGFPELWYSWRHQLGALADAGYRAYAPDLRGYGASAHPTEVSDYGSDKLTGDLCGLLDHYGHDTAAFVGHDWGAMVVWEMGRLHPARVSSLYNMSVPYSNAPAPPIQIFEALFPDTFFYMLYFQPVGPAEAEFDADPRRFLRTMLYSAGAQGMAHAGPLISDAPREGTRFQDILTPAPDVLPPWITEADVDVYAAAFEKGGFFGPCSYYRNMDANWERSHDIPASVYTMPTGFLTGALDPVALMMPERGRGDGRCAARLPGHHRRGGRRPLGAAGEAGRDQRRAAVVPLLVVSDLVALPAAAPRASAWPTDDWPTGRRAAGRRARPLLDEVFDDGGPLAETFAVLVVHRGRLVAERYAGALEHFDRPPTPVTADTPLLSWSMAKSVLHAVIGLLVGDGKLDLDAPATVPEWADPGDPRHAITLRQLLAMRDGLDFAEDYVDGEVSDTIQMLFGDGQARHGALRGRPPARRPAGHALQLLVGDLEHHFGDRGPRRGAGRALRPLPAQPALRPAGHDERRPGVRRGGHLGRLLLPVLHGPRLRPLRPALPARRHVGRRPPAARGMGRLMPAPGSRRTPRTPAPTAPTGGAWPATRSAPSGPRATRASPSRSVRAST